LVILIINNRNLGELQSKIYVDFFVTFAENESTLE
jgi:hypothetical protein